VLNLAFGFCGVYLAVFANLNDSFFKEQLIGNLMCLLSTTIYAAYLSFSSQAVQKVGTLAFGFWVFLYASICNLIFYFISLQFFPALQASDFANLMHLKKETLIAFGTLVLGCTVFTYGTNAFLLKTVSSAVVSGFVCLQVSLGLLFSRWFVNEPIEPKQWVSFALVTLGIFFLIYEQRSKQKTI
jgi:drug/metabolite transporter (DMT)-like permease